MLWSLCCSLGLLFLVSSFRFASLSRSFRFSLVFYVASFGSLLSRLLVFACDTVWFTFRLFDQPCLSICDKVVSYFVRQIPFFRLPSPLSFHVALCWYLKLRLRLGQMRSTSCSASLTGRDWASTRRVVPVDRKDSHLAVSLYIPLEWFQWTEKHTMAICLLSSSRHRLALQESLIYKKKCTKKGTRL